MGLVNPALVSSSATGAPGARDDWQTPSWIFDRLNDDFGFTLDAAALPETAMCSRFLTPQDDALSTGWGGRGSVVWLNPPYGRGVGNWLEKAHLESKKGAVVVVLVFSRTDTRWWHDYAMKASEIRFIRGRLRFLQDGQVKDPSPAPSCVLVFTPWSSGGPTIKTIEP